MEDRARDENYTNRSEVSLESLKHPQQESADQKMPAADEEAVVRSLLQNPKVLDALRQKLTEPEKAEGPSKQKQRLQAIVGFFLWVARGFPTWAKAIFSYVWTRLLAITMQLEIWKEKRSEMDELQRNLKAMNETHEKIAEKAAEIEDKVYLF